jgi:hypothetical protein
MVPPAAELASAAPAVSAPEVATPAFTEPVGPPPPSPPRRRRTGLLVAILAGVVVLAVVVGTIVALSGGSPVTRGAAMGAGASTPTTAPSPSTSPVSADGYQAALTALDQQLSPLVSQLGAATTPQAVGDSINQMDGVVAKDMATLRGMLPPEPVRAAHAQLLAALDSLDNDLHTANSQASGGRVCAGASGLSLVTQSEGARRFREAGQELAIADPGRAYHVGTSMPAPVGQQQRRPDNGTVVKKPGRTGRGELTIKNQKDDAVVTLAPVDSTSATVSVYVRGQTEYTYKGVPDGTYTIYVTLGEDWDPGPKVFTRSCTFEQFHDPMTMKTTSSQYTIVTVSLGMLGGTNPAQMDDADPSSFPH